jgi:hypothetical protein
MVSTAVEWKAQVVDMVKRRAWPKLWLSRAQHLFTAVHLKDAITLRSRMGLLECFMEDEAVTFGLKAVKTRSRARQQAALVEETHKAVAALDGQREELARELIGPRGGLPRNKTDLVKLATLLKVDVLPKDTLADITTKVKPMVEILKNRIALKESQKNMGRTCRLRASQPSIKEKINLTNHYLSRIFVVFQWGWRTPKIWRTPIGTCCLAWRPFRELVEGRAEIGLYYVRIDQCHFGLKGAGGGLHYKPTNILTSSYEVAYALQDCRCSKDHQHEPVIGGHKVTELAGHYPSALAELILDGLEAQFERLFHEVNVASPEGPAEVGHETEEDEDLDDDDDGDGDQPDDNPEVGEIGDGLHADPEGRAPGAEALEDAEAAVPVADGGDQPTTAEKKLAAHLHEMTGHRPVLCLARALVLTGAQPGLVKAVKQHKFEVCQELPTVKTHRPAGIPRACNFGDRIYSDLFAVPDVRLETFWIAHAIDGATRYQVAKVLDNKTAPEVVKFMAESWFQHWGFQLQSRLTWARNSHQPCSWTRCHTMMLQFITYLLKLRGKMDLQNGPVVCSKLFCEQPFARPQPWEWMMLVEPSLQRWRQSTLTPKVLATALLNGSWKESTSCGSCWSK